MNNQEQIFNLINEEKNRQLGGLELIASENFTSENVIDFSGLRDKVLQTEDLDVMNGIAHNKDKLFVTGKNWSKVFEVKVYSKN